MGQQRHAVVPMPQLKRTVLVVEDEDTPRRMVCRMLRACGYEVREARDGKDALRVLQQHPREVSLVIADVVMPVMTGAELRQRLSESPATPPILLMSGYGRAELLTHLGTLPPGPLLMKPFTAETLYRAIREALAPAVTLHAGGVSNALTR